MDTIIERLRVSPSPHITSEKSTRTIMRDVLIALAPATIGALYFFGMHALVVIVSAVVSAVAAEYIWQRIAKKRITINDYSAAITGLLLAFNLPATVPFWMPIIGSFFAIMIVKQLFGGLGHNFVNPALAARAVLLASWPARMTFFVTPGQLSDGIASSFTGLVDSVSSATPLALIKTGQAIPTDFNLFDLLIGNKGGCLGETSAVLLLIGGIYLLARGVINYRVPAGMLASIAVLAWVFGGHNGIFSGNLSTIIVHLTCGGAFLGAFFMASDYATTPVTPLGQLIFGIGCGIITMVIRFWGGYSEGVSYSILIMNVASPLIEKFTRPRTFGSEVKKRA